MDKRNISKNGIDIIGIMGRTGNKKQVKYVNPVKTIKVVIKVKQM